MLHSSTNENKNSAIIVGGSLSGLMTAISLAEENLHVTVFEKTKEGSRTGAGLQVDGSSFYMSKTEKRLRNLASSGESTVELWSSIEERLRKAAHKEENINLYFDCPIKEIGQNKEKAWVITSQEETFYSDILIAADGHRSFVRKKVLPEKPNADFAGYLVWMASLAKEELATESRPSQTTGNVEMMNSPDGFLFGSVMEDTEGVIRVGTTWYDNSQTELLNRLGAVKNGVVQHTIQGEDLSEEVIESLLQ